MKINPRTKSICLITFWETIINMKDFEPLGNDKGFDNNYNLHLNSMIISHN